MLVGDTGSSGAAMFSATPRWSVPAVIGNGRPVSAIAAARDAARQLVGETFFGLLLKEMRESTSKDHLLYGGRGETTLQPQLDQVLVERLATSRHFRLADAVVDRLYRDTEHSPIRSAHRVSGEGKEA